MTNPITFANIIISSPVRVTPTILFCDEDEDEDEKDYFLFFECES